MRYATSLASDQARLIRAADTFSSVSNWWPDYPGDNMFNSLGNLAFDSAAALLFADFATGHAVHLSGTAVLEWSPGGSDDGAPRHAPHPVRRPPHRKD